MPLNPSNSSYHPAKRMRLGTKSCSECRRRKVRCIFQSTNQVCDQCTLHGAPCTAQQPGQVRKDKEDNAQQRLSELEGMVRHICGAIGLNIESSSLSDFELGTAEALKRLRPPLTPVTSSYTTSMSREASLDQSDYESVSDSTQKFDSLDDAPLLSLFKAAMLIERSEAPLPRDRHEPFVDPLIRTCITSLESMLPSNDDFDLILDSSRKYWLLLKAFPETLLSSCVNIPDRGVELIKTFILDSLKSESPPIVVKAVFGLCLCLQQLPGDFKYHEGSVTASPTSLIESFMSTAEYLLIPSSSAGTIEGLECLMIQAKLFINMGKPRKAWLSYRRALNFALLQGLHHPEECSDERKNSLWSAIWQSERQLALIIGTPYGVSESHPSLLIEYAGESIPQRIMHELAIIAGHVIDRNQNHRNDDYLVTLQIDQELRNCRSQTLSTWWDADLSALPLEAAYGITVVKLHYFQLMKILHLPYILTSSSGEQYQTSQVAGLEASRDMVRAYQKFRNGSGSALVLCDLMDFQVMTAAVLLVVNLLSDQHDAANDFEDWDLVNGVNKNLQRLSVAMKCTVAGQAARLLDYLIKSYQGTYSGPELFENTIPYFGRVRISQAKKSPLVNPVSPNDLSAYPPNSFSTMVEFGADSSMHFGQFPTGDLYSDAELGIDWGSFVNLDTVNYDWNQVFYSSESF
jgi:hypothetical protein